MTSDLTINTIVFAKSFDEKDGSERRSTTRGVNTPDILAIKRQDAIDSKSKVPQKRYMARFDRVNIDAASGKKYTTSAYVVIAVPELAVAVDIDNVVASLRAFLASSSPNYITQILNSES
jgi:hypothetical protein